MVLHTVVNGRRVTRARYENEFLIKPYEFNGTKASRGWDGAGGGAAAADHIF